MSPTRVFQTESLQPGLGGPLVFHITARQVNHEVLIAPFYFLLLRPRLFYEGFGKSSCGVGESENMRDNQEKHF